MNPDINRYKRRTDYTQAVRPRPQAAAPAPPPPAKPRPVSVTINIHLPRFKKPESLRPRWSKQTAVLALAAVLLSAGAYSLIPKSQPRAAQPALSQPGLGTSTQNISISPPAGSAGSASQSIVVGNTGTSPDARAAFTPVAPAGDPSLGKYVFGRTSYDGATGVYLYEDTLDGAPLSVTQQAIPAGNTSAQAVVDKVAASINATQSFAVPGGTAYMYANPKNGQQIMVFSLFGILIYMNSSSAHSTSDWQSYINSLH